MSSSHSPCAACKCRRQKCTQECVFAPYFPPDNPQKFINVHKVFGASNVSKLLNELDAAHREDAVSSLAYEAESRLKDPVYGCVGLISILQSRLKQVNHDLVNAKKELATYIGPSAMLPMINHPGSGFVQQHAPSTYQIQMAQQQATGIPAQLQQLQEQQFLEAQQIVREQEMIRTYQQQHQQQQADIMRFNGGFEEGGSSVTATGFNQMGEAGMHQPRLALGTCYGGIPYQQIQQQQLDLELQALLQFQQQNACSSSHQPELRQLSQKQASRTQQPLLLASSEEDRSTGPSC